ncbi:glycosyltransferase family 2 protein [Neobacillus sp. SAB-20_R2A]|uniref:glycosyltransferase family 2 protein n=1 Tax=Neobacillus sp. SAB-20_R2A TaxID=3120519 RepID=UPI003C6E7BD2
MDKISILMPTYNDAAYIEKSIQSIQRQSYQNWELIVVNDGSTDETEKIIQSINDDRIKYYAQENSGQLNAVLHASKYIEGNIVLLFHSDDELANNEVFSLIINTFNTSPDIDGLYADYLTIDENSRISGTMKRPDEIDKKELIRKVFFHKGDNLIGDTFIVKKDIFVQYILQNYIYDNTIYYVDYKNFNVLNLKKISPWYKYRVFGENYIHSDVGKFEVANGCFRTVYKLLFNHFKTGPMLALSNLTLFKIFRKLKLYNFSKVSKGDSVDIQLAIKLFELWKKELVVKGYPKISMMQISKILHSLSSMHKTSNPLYLKREETDSISYLFYGKDARRFYNEYKSDSINSVYKKILESNYDHIVVDCKESKEIVQKILLFYSFFYEIKVE